MLVGVVLMVALLITNWEAEPVYKGVPLSRFLDPKYGGIERGHEAIRVLGSKAVEYLMNVLESEPTGRQLLYRHMYPKLPSGLKHAFSPPAQTDVRRLRAAAIIRAANTNAIPALPLLIRIAESDGHRGTRYNALGSVASIAAGTAEPQQAIAVILKATRHRDDPGLRQLALSSLGQFTNHLDMVVPALLHGLRNTETRETCLWALRTIGTNAMRVVREQVHNEGYLPMSFKQLEQELATQNPK